MVFGVVIGPEAPKQVPILLIKDLEGDRGAACD